MRHLVLLLSVLIVSISARADLGSTGYSDNTQIIGTGSDQCTFTLYYNHDGSFENGFCWEFGGTVPGTTYGAFGEGYDLGYGMIECVAIWATQVGFWSGQPLDIYVWEGGVTGPPGEVTDVRTGAQLTNVPYWPSLGQSNIETSFFVQDEFTIGFWADFSAEICGWYVGADLDGLGGYPWTNIAPGIGYPTGWNNPAIAWGSCQSLGIGVYFSHYCSPVEAVTWGEIKSLFPAGR
jgi:hypothetical protein